jgi:hypothetical protein
MPGDPKRNEPRRICFQRTTQPITPVENPFREGPFPWAHGWQAERNLRREFATLTSRIANAAIALLNAAGASNVHGIGYD